MLLNRIHHPVTALGPGSRAGIWVQGCSIGCRGCVSRDTWAFDRSTTVEAGAVLDWLASLAEPELDGVTVSGGEPFDQPEALAELLDGIERLRAARRAPLDVLVYSGRPLDWLRRRHPELLRRVDAAITGPFVHTNPTRLIWRGSANQQLVPLSPLGHERYRRFVDHEPDRAPIQVAVDDGVWMVGVPRAGDVARLEQRLQQAGIELSASSWHAPDGSGGGAPAIGAAS